MRSPFIEKVTCHTNQDDGEKILGFMLNCYDLNQKSRLTELSYTFRNTLPEDDRCSFFVIGSGNQIRIVGKAYLVLQFVNYTLPACF
jgi:hypothetical protein